MKCLKNIILGVAVSLLVACEGSEGELPVVDHSLPMQMPLRVAAAVLSSILLT